MTSTAAKFTKQMLSRFFPRSANYCGRGSMALADAIVSWKTHRIKSGKNVKKEI